MQATKSDIQDYLNTSVCSACLSSDRKLTVLIEFPEIYELLCKKIVRLKRNSEIYLCWECLALLRNVKKFQGKVKRSHEMMKNYIKNFKKIELGCLTSLSMTAPTITDSKSPSLSQMGQIKQEFDVVVKQETSPVLDDFESKPLIVIKEDSPPKIFLEEINKGDSDSPEMISEDFYDICIEHDIKNNDPDSCKKELEIIENSKLKSSKRGRPPKAKKMSNTPDKCESQSEENGINVGFSKVLNNEELQNTTKEIPSERPITISYYKMSVKRSKLYKFLGNKKIEKKRNIYTSIKVPFHEVKHWMVLERNSDYFRNSNHKCHRCASNIKETVMEKHNALHALQLKYKCDICGLPFDRKSSLTLHMRRHCIVRQCNICGYKCLRKLHMYSHARSHGKYAVRPVECLECHDTFMNTRLFYDHYRKTHYEINHLYVCDYCSKKYLQKKKLIQHISRHHTPQVCKECDAKFSTYGALRNHRNIKHLIERTEASYCVQCDKQFDNIGLYKVHLGQAKAHAAERKTLKKRSYQCPTCYKEYTKSSTMKNHYNQKHSGKPRYVCTECNTTYMTNVQLKNHTKYYHLGVERKKNKICTVCGRGFSKKATLVNHMRTHTGERPHACPHCRATFAQRVAMQAHVRNIHMKRDRSVHMLAAAD